MFYIDKLMELDHLFAFFFNEATIW
ncbi:uncharacterized protein METZ01_LOCUS237864 [marine metagenome]|uniref:Uncharacterized protein n=1 Tax=marine metagenome TaxID=408172 RepID=A0A382HCK3_9ZZZZ